MAAHSVTVALLGRPDQAFTGGAIDWETFDHEPGRFDECHRVALDVSEEETIGHILTRAAEHFEIPVPADDVRIEYPNAIGFVAFDQPGRPIELRHELVLVDEDGRAQWGVWEWRETSYGDVLRAFESGAMTGDPSRVYLILLPPMGDYVGILHWSQLLAVWDILHDVIEEVGIVGGAAMFGKAVLDGVKARIRRGKAAVQPHFIDWDERGAATHLFKHFLHARDWDPAVLAVLLGSSVKDAEGVLSLYGFENHDGISRPGEGEAARILQGAITQAHLHSDETSFESILKKSMRNFLDTGQLEEPAVDEPPEEAYTEPTDSGPVEPNDVACQCGDESCTVTAGLYRPPFAWHTVKFKFEKDTDHFAVAAETLGWIAGRYARPDA